MLRFSQKQIDDKPKQTNKLFGTLFQITFYHFSEKHTNKIIKFQHVKFH
jgi:hypothetical protein